MSTEIEEKVQQHSLETGKEKPSPTVNANGSTSGNSTEILVI